MEALGGPLRRAVLPSLTAYRALAAGVVFLHHLPDAAVPLGLGRFGYAAVPFFFVLSGFVLTWSGAGAAGFRPFLTRRVARIYPSHLVVAAILLAGPFFVQFTTPSSDLAAVLLVQAWVPDLQYAYALDGVTWSLACEMVFYVLFVPICLGLGRLRTTTVLAIGLVAQAATGPVLFAAAAAPTDSPLFAFANTDPLMHLPSFLLGIAGARWLQDGRRAAPLPLALPAVAAALVGLVAFPVRPLPDLWLPPVFLLLIVWTARHDARGRPVLGARPLVYAGEVSFAFYLVHQPVLINVERTWDAGGPQWAAALVVSVAAAVALHHLVEKPAHRALLALDRRLRRASARRAGRTGAAAEDLRARPTPDPA